jgi:hypothetical protein
MWTSVFSPIWLRTVKLHNAKGEVRRARQCSGKRSGSGLEKHKVCRCSASGTGNRYLCNILL